MTMVITQTIEILKIVLAYSRQLLITTVLLVYRPKFKFLAELFSLENDIVKHFYDIFGHDDLVTVCQDSQFCKSTNFRFLREVVLVL